MLNIRVALSIFRLPWLVDATTLAIGQRILAGDKLELEEKSDAYKFQLYHDDDNDDGSASMKRMDGAVAVFPISGTLLKEDTWCSYGTQTIAQAIRGAANDDRITAIVLDINSGGGCVNAIAPMLQAIEEIKSLGKPVLAHVDFCCSAAYWIASATDRIYMDNSISSAVGSIGAYSQVVETAPGDLEKNGYTIHTIYADESPDKNKAYRALQTGDEGPYKADLSFLVSAFQKDVKKNRVNLAADADGVLSGDIFYSEKAIANGLVDGVMTLEEVIAVAALNSAKPNQSI